MARAAFTTRCAMFLEHIQQMPGVGGALLLSAWPRLTPEPPVCSSAWDTLALQDPDRLRGLARHLAQIKDVTYVERSAREPVPVSWLAGACARTTRANLPSFPCGDSSRASSTRRPRFKWRWWWPSCGLRPARTWDPR